MTDFLYKGARLALKDFIAWRRSQMVRQEAVNRSSHWSREYLAAGAPRYFATFAHDGNSAVINAFGRPEAWQMDTIFAYLAERGLVGGVALDIGANIGIHSVLFARKYARVVSFEPHPHTFQLLRYNLATYAPNAVPMEMALFNEARPLTLTDMSQQNIGAFSLRESSGQAAGFQLTTRRLDDVAEACAEPVGLIKIDTEGTEHEVLQGALGLIGRDHPVILMEDFKSRNGRRSEAVEFLARQGYVHFLEPAFFPSRHPGNGLSCRLRTLFDVWRQGHAFGLRECDYSAPKGYDLLVALHESHLAPAGTAAE